MIEKTKKCGRCKEYKLFSEFGKHRSMTYGLSNYCRICACKSSKISRKKNYNKEDRHNKYILNKDKYDESGKKYYHEHKDHKMKYALENRRKIKHNNLKKYNISIEDYEEKLDKQNGVCAICECAEEAKTQDNKRIRMLAVDHNHTTGQVRGLLCTKCNTALGLLREDKSIIIKALAYLDEYKTI
jgi:hypothetical protein